MGHKSEATGMAGSQTLVAYKNSSTGLAVVRTFDISSYSSIVRKDLSFEVWTRVGEQRRRELVGADGMLAKHEFAAANLHSKGTLDLKNGTR
ncbi:hypothetical protein F3Y22_tig00111105pilonHSYRG00087 [Hibiscus syriacus]|uniref:AIR12 DOMON domain-containing protein n=1 Tax=Hibiscus syriacus TaxID=106335 RepID=A0A6A2Z0L1_HIBSY|nr:hypothetical protein F3Y22_tig00111105pilonHSYRG00087 [Hibiscus syriacus]